MGDLRQEFGAVVLTHGTVMSGLAGGRSFLAGKFRVSGWGHISICSELPGNPVVGAAGSKWKRKGGV